jgi:hypothetical protein
METGVRGLYPKDVAIMLGYDQVSAKLRDELLELVREGQQRDWILVGGPLSAGAHPGLSGPMLILEPRSTPEWRKSSRSTDISNCVEVAWPDRAVTAVRDSKNTGPVLTFPADAWSAFLKR